MGQLGLDDIAEPADQSVQMPEDMPSSPMPFVSSQPAKRKVTEIADSEDEEDLENGIRSPPSSRQVGGFLPSSQVMQNQDEQDSAGFRTAKDMSNAEEKGNQDDEMLLQD